MSAHVPNRLERQLAEISDVPGFARNWYRSVVLRRAVPFTRTAGLDFLRMDCDCVEIGIRNERKVRNHLGGVHASAMNLLAETATGMVVGMNVRDDCLPLAREMKVVFVRRATGSLKAVATLDEAQRALIRGSDRGEITVPVVVTDEAGMQPVACSFVWAWEPFSPREGERS